MKGTWIVALGCWMAGVIGWSQPADERSKSGADLPLSEVILYSSGVGYFQREGEVTGNAKVELKFREEEINDLLKSMVVQDLGAGRVGLVSYDSRDPLERALKSFGLDLTGNPGLGQLLNQLRGESVEVLRPNPMTGKILGVEKKVQPVGEDKTVEVEILNLVTEGGFQSVPMAQIQKIKLLNSRLNEELQQALLVLARSHDTQKKAVGIEFEGEGKRKVSVAYIAQSPVWKTAYRLVLGEKEPPFLQGWAIVENTSDEDWAGVRMSLVSGRPISFTMDLYQPLYATRPVVTPERYQSLRPQVYGDAMESEEALVAGLALAPRATSAVAPEQAAVMRPQMAARNALSARAEAGGQADRSLKRQISEGVGAVAQGMETGELFEYHIKNPVTLARQKSAMLPIVNQAVAGEKVSIYNSAVQGKHPLHGFRLKNTSGLHLMQGPITVFEGGAYAGDARIEDLAAGQERLLSYALDLKIEVEPQNPSRQQELVEAKLKRGTLVVTRKASEEKVYLIRNRAGEKRTVLIEHPFRADWKLVEPANSTERTRDFHRFAMTVDLEKSAKLTVREEQPISETVQLANAGIDVIGYYIRAQKVSPKVKAALQRVVELRNALSATGAERGQREQRINEITVEQARIRENMGKLSETSELHVRLVKKLDQQETELESLRTQIESLKEKEQKQRKGLDDYLLGLEVS